MKKLLIILIFNILPFTIFAEEGITFFKGTWTEVQAEAQKQHKMIFVDVYTVWCGPCKMMEKSVFPNPEVGKIFNANFINYQLDAEKDEGIALAEKYDVKGFPTSLFMNEFGEPVFKIMGAMEADLFIKQAEKALENIKLDKPLATLESDFKEGKLSTESIQILFNKMKMSGKSIYAILDEYLNSISETEKNKEEVLSLIAKNTESINSKAFELLTEAYNKRMKFAEGLRYEIIGGIDRIQYETLKQITEANDKTKLEELVSVMKTKLHRLPLEIEQVEMNFAEKTKDKEMFKKIALKKAPTLLKPSNEDLRKQSLFTVNSFKMGAKMNKMDTTSEMYQMQMKYLVRASESNTARELNTIAWGYFEMIDDKTDLEEALKWSKRSIEIENNPSYMDTEANLLFKLGRKKEAIKTMKETIILAKKIGEPTNGFEETLKKMKSN